MNVLFFARLREALGADSLELADAALPKTVAELRNAVIERAQTAAIDARQLPEFVQAMRDPNVLCAVNRRVAHEQQRIGASDEIAFYPPVTGG